MATYKVIQDIEAEDKLLGPLSLRQFVYACICIGFGYLAFLVISSGLALAAIIFIPPCFLFGFLAFPWRGDQPTEVWALAKIQFLVKPRKRIWNQSGVKELVTITVPKRIERVYSNGFTQSEVRSRLKALADTIDSRGWVIKNVPVGYGQHQTSDRLLDASVGAQRTASFEVRDSEDILDAQNNSVAQKFDSMIAASEKAHHDEIIARMNEPVQEAPQPATTRLPAAPVAAAPVPVPSNTGATQAADYWFLNQPQGVSNIPQDRVTFNTQVVAPGAPAAVLPVAAAAPTADEEAFIREHSEGGPLISPNRHGHLHVIQPLSEQGNQTVAAGQPLQPAYVKNEGPSAQVLAQTPATVSPASQNTNTQNTDRAKAIAAAQQQVTAAQDAAILDLARNDDLNVATIAREAQKRKEAPDEVVISLH